MGIHGFSVPSQVLLLVPESGSGARLLCAGEYGILLVCLWSSHLLPALSLYVGDLEVMPADTVSVMYGSLHISLHVRMGD